MAATSPDLDFLLKLLISSTRTFFPSLGFFGTGTDDALSERL
jgi:hypothetical protein